MQLKTSLKSGSIHYFVFYANDLIERQLICFGSKPDS